MPNSFRRVLLVHNRYQQPGGEDSVFSAETSLLRERGHEVLQVVEDNRRLDDMGALSAASRTVWSRESKRRLERAIRDFKPDVVHFHNTFLLVSPSGYYAARGRSVPVVQTLHNYRLICPAGTLFRRGQICEACVGRRLAWPGVAHGCYRRSRARSLVVAAMLGGHRLLGTWSREVDVYVALTTFARDKFVQGGLPADRIVVKPNFVHPDPGPRQGQGRYALFVGRLGHEKGVLSLLRAWADVPELALKIVGDGPVRAKVESEIARAGDGRVELLGRRPRDEVVSLMKEARFLVFPSEWYEGFPMTIAEAFACGVPVLTSGIGSLREIVRDGVFGRHFEPGDPSGLAAAVRWALDNPDRLREMGRSARREFEERYSGTASYRELMSVYGRARAVRSGTDGATPRSSTQVLDVDEAEETVPNIEPEAAP